MSGMGRGDPAGREKGGGGCPKFAHLLTSEQVRYSVEYFHPRVLAEVEDWPVGILADYTRLVELLMEFGPDLRMPHSRAMGKGLFELRPHGREGIGRALYCYVKDARVIVLHAFVKKERTTPERDLAIARQRMKEVQNG